MKKKTNSLLGKTNALLLFLTLGSLSIQAQTPWAITGNSAGANDFIGTTNNIPFVIKTNNTEALRVMPGGVVGIGVAPTAGDYSMKLRVNGSTHITSGNQDGDVLVLSKLGLTSTNGTHYMYFSHRKFSDNIFYSVISAYEYGSYGIPRHLILQEHIGGNLGIGTFTTQPVSKLSVNGTSFLNGRVGINTSPESTTVALTVAGTTQLDGRVGLNTAPDSPGAGTADVAINGVTRITASAEGGDAFRLRLAGPKNHYVYIANRLFTNANTIEYGAIGAYEYTTSGTPKHLLIQDQYNGGNLGIGYFDVPPAAKLTVNGNMCIGDNYVPTGYILAVKGKVIAEEIAVKLRSRWGDFCFAPEFKLMKLSEVEAYVKKHSHLPGVPSASEIETKGLELGEMENILMQKVEELTLYAIEQDKTIDQLLKLIEAQNVRLEKLENK